MRTRDSLADLSGRQLLSHFGDLVRRDRLNTAQLLAALVEIDERKLWAKDACSSMFVFCVERFRMSESMTGKRIWAARTARRFPVIFQMVARGELHLSAIVRLAKHLTDDNHRAVLRRARHKSSREIDLLVAELAPRPDVPSRIRALPRTAGSVSGSQSQSAGGSSTQRPGHALESCSTVALDVTKDERAASDPAGRAHPVAGLPNASRLRGQVVALAPRRYKIEISVDQETHDKLRMLQDLLGHRVPDADPAVIVSRAIDRLLADTLKKKAALTDRVQRGERRDGRRSERWARTIPAAIRREVWQRDGGRCTFVDHQGRRCRGMCSVEFHHVTPYAKGGQHEASNIALRCRAHNQYEADLDFGQKFMRDKRCGNSVRSPGNVVEVRARR